MLNILGDEVGNFEARVNEERITQDDFAGTGGAVDGGGFVARHDVSFDVPVTARACDSAQLRTDLHLPQRLDTVPVNSLEVLTFVGSMVGRKKPLSPRYFTIVSEIATASAPESMRHAKR